MATQLEANRFLNMGKLQTENTFLPSFLIKFFKAYEIWDPCSRKSTKSLQTDDGELATGKDKADRMRNKLKFTYGLS